MFLHFLWLFKISFSIQNSIQCGAKLLFWHGNQQRQSSPCWIGDEASVRVRGQTAASGCADPQNFL